MIRRRYLAVLTVAALASCQQVLGITPGTRLSGTGATGGAPAGSSTSGPGGLGGGPGGTGGAFTTGTSSSSSGATTSTSTTGSSSSSSTSTGTTTGASSSSSSSSSSGCTTTPVIADYIDDMMSGQGHILVKNGRVGPWFTANNDQTTDMQTPVPGMVCDPVTSGSTCFMYSMNTSGTLVGTDAYAQVGFDLDQTGGVTKPYNASTYTGIVFWAKATTALNLHVQFPIPATVSNSPASAGGTCIADAGIYCGDSLRGPRAPTVPPGPRTPSPSPSWRKRASGGCRGRSPRTRS